MLPFSRTGEWDGPAVCSTPLPTSNSQEQRWGWWKDFIPFSPSLSVSPSNSVR